MEDQKLDIEEVCTRIGNNINKLRIKKGVTQNEMAYEAQTSSCLISDIENGKRPKVHFSTLIRIANYFEVPLEKIIE